MSSNNNNNNNNTNTTKNNTNINTPKVAAGRRTRCPGGGGAAGPVSPPEKLNFVFRPPTGPLLHVYLSGVKFPRGRGPPQRISPWKVFFTYAFVVLRSCFSVVCVVVNSCFYRFIVFLSSAPGRSW